MRVPRLPRPGVAVIENLVYAVGGSNRDDGTRSNLNSMERYNPEKDEWEDMPPMHRSRGAASVTALNNCLYAVGGYDSGKRAGILEYLVYSVVGSSQTHVSLSKDCLEHLKNCFGCRFEVCFVIYCVLSVGQWLCEVERFDPHTSQWSLIAPMHHSRTGVAVTALRGEW